MSIEGAEIPPAQSGELVTVVIPSFNAEKFIETTLRSVLEGSYENVEVIVVDDRSTDRTVEIVAAIARADRRVRLIRLSCNSGTPGAPRNAGVRAACGMWVAFLDADDVWHPRKLEIQMQVLQDQRAPMCSSIMHEFVDETQIVPTEPKAIRVRRVTLLDQLIKYRTPTSSIVIHRSLVAAHPFNEEIAFKAREDTDCFTRAHEFMRYSVKVMHPLLFYRQQANQISKNKWRMVGRHLNMLRKYRLKSGRRLGLFAYFFTFTHFSSSIYIRLIRKTL